MSWFTMHLVMNTLMSGMFLFRTFKMSRVILTK